MDKLRYAMGLITLLVPWLSLQGIHGQYTAAVYSHAVYSWLNPDRDIPTREDAINIKDTNINVFEEQIKLAKREGVDIILFPEYGINGFGLMTRDAVFPLLEEIPDPKVFDWCPYVDETFNQSAHANYRLSMMAKEKSMYVVANLGEKEVCGSDEECPGDGQYQFNTNVVYNSEGCLIARYRKFNLYHEPEYDTPQLQYITFDAPFGRFGLITCFDILWKEPSITLTEEHGTDNILFPAAFNDGLPLMAAVEFASAWSRRMKVNILAANIQDPTRFMSGSGIFSPEGPLAYYRNMNHTEGKLLIAKIETPSNITNMTTSSEMALPLITKTSESTFVSNLSSDPYHWVVLQNQTDKLKLCIGKVCCYLAYKMSYINDSELYAFGVFDGLHYKNGVYYLQVCTLVKCANLSTASCGSPVEGAKTVFSYIDLKGTFQTPYIFPTLNTDGVNFAPENWSFNSNQTRLVSEEMTEPLLSTALYGRYYEKDHQSDVNSSPLLVSKIHFLLNFVIWSLVYNFS